MEILPTGGALGAEVRGIDVGRPLSETVVSAIRRAILDHQFLVFRDQDLSEEEQVRFSRYFGAPEPHVRDQPDRSVAEIFVISNVIRDGKPLGQNRRKPFPPDERRILKRTQIFGEAPFLEL